MAAGPPNLPPGRHSSHPSPGRARHSGTNPTTEPPLTSDGPIPDRLSPALLPRMDAYWRAANYLSVGQIYLRDNPLLESPLSRDHIKPRLLGHWGTTPGLSFLYVHLDALIKWNDTAPHRTGRGSL